MSKRILIVLTSHDTLGKTGRKTGFHYEELATPFRRFVDAGFAVQIASPKGGMPPHDPTSLELLEQLPDDAAWFRGNEAAMHLLTHTRKLADTSFEEFDAVFFPGGHGTVFDLPQDAVLAEKLGRFFDTGKLVGAVCHGPAALLGARKADGRPIVEGLRVNAFTNAEEAAIELTDIVPMLLEDALREQGGRYEHAGMWTGFAVKDANLVTGQNPQSAGQVADLMVKALLN
jgi:putative intracellular protease/amidase